MILPLLGSQPDASDSFDLGRAVALLGSPHGRLLAGCPSTTRPESLEENVKRLGRVDATVRSPAELQSLVEAAGLVGRGGGEFPLARKLALAARSPGVPLVVVNASEGEPASRKDETLLRLRPHLVLDGAEVIAAAVGADEVVVYLHRDRPEVIFPVEFAIDERRRAGRRPRVSLAEAPDRYVSGEASAVVAFLEGGAALPRRARQPAAASGVRGRPTVVSNTETSAHVALIARFGAPFFCGAGSTATPGSTLLTLAGDVASPGLVVELLRPATIGAILSDGAELAVAPRAVLIGGYAGTWVDGATAWATSVDRNALRAAGAPLGCGLIAVLGHGRCGVAETARLLAWMAAQSSGQCGPCASGLPAIAELAAMLAAGRARSGDLTRLRSLAVAVRGRGACGHPSGAAELLESALDTFADEVRQHLRGRSCRPAGVGLPLPATSDEAFR